jgi:hypothetical protein
MWRHRVLLWIACACLCLASPVAAKEIYVNNQAGSDQNAGTSEAPLRSARRAVTMAGAGDVIHLLPDRAVYREMITLADKRDLTIEGHNCVLSGADPLPSDPAQWEKVGEGLHRIKRPRTTGDRHILVIDGKGVTMGRTPFTMREKPLRDQFPKPEDLKEGQFAWQAIDSTSGWLYVKGPLDKLEWSVRVQGVYTEKEVHDVTIRDLHTRHVLNDGYNIHGNTQGLRLFNVSGNECFDNGISPHGACSFTVENGEFAKNSVAIGLDFLTETRFVRCRIEGSVHQEAMIIGGRHVFENCQIRAAAPVAVRMIYSKPPRQRTAAWREIEASGKDPDMKPRYLFRNCTLESSDGTPREIDLGQNVHVAIEACTLKGINFRIDPAASVDIAESTLDGKPVTAEQIKRAKAGGE